MKSPLINESVLPALRSSWATGALAAGISALAGAFGASSANWNSVYQQRLQQTYNEENAKKQHRYNLEYLAQQLANSKELWNLENAYQTPAMQVARLLEAGGNPAALFGLGNGSSASAHAQLPSTPSAGLPSAGFGHGVAPNFSGLGGLVEGVLADAEVNLKNAQADNLRDQTEKNYPVQRAMWASMTNNYDKQSGLSEAQTIYQSTLNSIAERSADDQVEGYRLRNDLTYRQIHETVARTQKTFNEAEDLRYKIEHLNPVEYEQAVQDLKHTAAMTALAWAQKALADKNVEYTEQGLQNLILENENIAMETAVKGWKARQAKREYRWMPWQKFTDIVGSLINSVMSVYSKGASARLMNKQASESGRYDSEETGWYDPETQEWHRSSQSRRY